jgi:hypothetical protein
MQFCEQFSRQYRLIKLAISIPFCPDQFVTPTLAEIFTLKSCSLSHSNAVFGPSFHAVFEIIFRPNLAHFDPIFADRLATPFLPIADHFATPFLPIADHFATPFLPIADHFATPFC